MRRIGLAMATVCLLLEGCRERSDLDRLVADGATAFAVISQYYDRLGAITIEAWQNQAAFLALAGSAVPPELQTVYQQRADELARRSELARAIGNAYSSVASLRSPGGLAGVVQAGQSLGTAINGIHNLPGGSLMKSDDMGQAAQFLVELRRKSDSRRALASMVKSVSFLSDLFANERALYLAMQEDRDGTADRLIRQLEAAKIIKMAGLLRDLHIGVTAEAFQEDKVHEMAFAVAGVSAYRKRLAWGCATERTAAALSLAASQEKDVATSNAAALEQLEQNVARAKTCLADYQTLEGTKP